MGFDSPQFWFSSWDFVFLSFCMRGNFLLDVGHYQFYLVRCWILYSCKYFCVPVNILELFSGILFNYWEKVWSFWAWQNHAHSRAATEARPFYVLCPVFHEPWSFPILLERAGVIPIRKWALDTLPPFYWGNSFLLWVVFSHVWIAQHSGRYLKSTFHRSLAFSCSVALFSLDQVDLICLSCQLEQTLVSPNSLLSSSECRLVWTVLVNYNADWKLCQGNNTLGQLYVHLICILSGLIVLHCMMFSVLKMVVLYILHFFGYFRWELLVKCLRPYIHVTFNRLRLNRKTHWLFRKLKETFLYNGSQFLNVYNHFLIMARYFVFKICVFRFFFLINCRA